MPRSRIHVSSRPVRVGLDNFREIEWDVAISYQVWDLRCCYGVNMAVTGSTSSYTLLAKKGSLAVPQVEPLKVL